LCVCVCVLGILDQSAHMNLLNDSRAAGVCVGGWGVGGEGMLVCICVP